MDENRPQKPPSLVGTYMQEVQRLDQEARAKKRFRNVEGFPFWPHEVVRDLIFICFFMAFMLALSGFVPYYLEAPADPTGQPHVILPDWYLLWSYGLLKIAVDVQLFGATLVTAQVLGVLLNAVVIAPLIILPFAARQHARRPVADPFWGAVGMLGIGYAFTLSAASVDTLIVEAWPWTAQRLLGYKVVYWATLLLPVVLFFVSFYFFRSRKARPSGQAAYENRLSDTYFKIR